MAVPRPRGTAGALPGEEAVRASKRRRPSICYTERLSRTGRRPPVDSPAMTDLDEQGHPEPPLAGDETATLVAEALADGGLDQLATGVTNDQGESPSLRRLFGMATLPAARGRGAAREVLAALARWADGHGAGHLYLQVEPGNDAAWRLHERAGFTELSGYHYRTAGRVPT